MAYLRRVIETKQTREQAKMPLYPEKRYCATFSNLKLGQGHRRERRGHFTSITWTYIGRITNLL